MRRGPSLVACVQLAARIAAHLLNGRAGKATICAEDAASACFGPEHRIAFGAVPEELTALGGHGRLRCSAALGACDDRSEFNGRHDLTEAVVETRVCQEEGFCFDGKPASVVARVSFSMETFAGSKRTTASGGFKVTSAL